MKRANLLPTSKRLWQIFLIAIIVLPCADIAYGQSRNQRSRSKAKSPVGKGSMIISGSAYYQSASGVLYEDGNGDGQSTLGFYPSVGFFLSDGFLLGIRTDFYVSSQGEFSRSGVGAGPEIGYYAAIGGKRTGPGASFVYIRAFALFSNYTVEDLWWDPYDELPVKITRSNSFRRSGGEVGMLMMLSNAVGVNVGVSATNSAQGEYKVLGRTYSNEDGTVIRIGMGVTAFVF